MTFRKAVALALLVTFSMPVLGGIGKFRKTLHIPKYVATKIGPETFPRKFINSVKFNKKKDLCIIAFNDGKLGFIDLNRRKVANEVIMEKGSIDNVTISPDGTTMITSGKSQNAPQLVLWDITNPENVVLKHLLELPYTSDFEISQDNSFAITSEEHAEGKNLIICDLKNPKGREVVDIGPCLSIKINPLENSAFMLTPPGELRLANFAKNSRVFIKCFPGLENICCFHILNGDIIAGTFDGQMIAFDTTREKMWAQYQNTGRINAIAADNKNIATVSNDNTIKIWNKNMKPLATIHTHDAPATRVGINGTLVVSGDKNGEIHFWDLQHLQQIGKFTTESEPSDLFITNSETMVIVNNNHEIVVFER